MCQHVSAFCHEMHTAENDIFRAGACRFLRQFVRVATKIGKADHFIPLVMVAQVNRARAKFASGRGNARVHGVIGEYKVVIERATDASLFPRGNRSRHFQVRLQSRGFARGTEMLKASIGSSGSTALLGEPMRAPDCASNW